MLPKYTFDGDELFNRSGAMGYGDFFDGVNPDASKGLEYMCGWFLARERIYGEGVKSSLKSDGNDVDCPYEQFSTMWEAWCDGYNQESQLEPT